MGPEEYWEGKKLHGMEGSQKLVSEQSPEKQGSDPKNIWGESEK